MSIYPILDRIGNIDTGARVVCLSALAMDTELREEVVNLSSKDDIQGVADKLHLDELLRQDDLISFHKFYDKGNK